MVFVTGLRNMFLSFLVSKLFFFEEFVIKGRSVFANTGWRRFGALR